MTSLFCGTVRATKKSEKPKDVHKTRRKWRQLPEPTGPHTVGIVDIMTDTEDRSCFFRLFYPTHKQDVHVRDSEWPLWLPRQQYVDGLVYFLNKNPTIYGRVFKWIAGGVYIPALLESPVSEPDSRYPVVVFSHGLGGNRTMNATLCMELASHGFVVAALEHRDGSASMSYILKRKQSADNSMADTVNSEGTTGSDDDIEVNVTSTSTEECEEEWMMYDRPDRWDNFEFRNKQVNQRSRECIWALDILEKLNHGAPIDNLLHSTFDLSQFKDKLDLSSAAMVGHSFGGASCLSAMHLDSRFKVAVPIDMWMFGIDDEVYTSLSQPILFINSAMFHWKRNLEQMQRLLNDREHHRKIITIKGTCHQSSSDFQFIMHKHVAKILGTRDALEPPVAMELHAKATLSFLRIHLDLPGERFSDILSGEHEHILPGPHVFRKSDPVMPAKKRSSLKLKLSKDADQKSETAA